MKKMSRILALFIFTIFIAIMIGCSGQKETLHIYTWVDNIDEEVIAEFEEKHGVKITMSYYSSNEEMLAKLQAGGSQYDLIQPSDYMVEIMMELDMLEKLNKENIPNLANMVSNFQTPPFDPDKEYSIVYTWGVTGIAYNTKYVTDPITSWNDLWNPKYSGRVVLLNDPREVIGMGLIKNGFSNSSTKITELETAVNDLRGLVPHILAFDTDAIKQKFVDEEAWIGTVWSGDAAFIYEDNDSIEFVVPKEGATIWADTLAIPKGAKNKELAEKFINYLLEPEVSVKNYESIGYSNPNEKAYPLHSEEYRSNKMIFIDQADLDRTEWLVDVGDLTGEYDRFWTQLKSGR